MTVILVYNQFRHFDFMNVRTVCCRSNISKNWKPKPDDNCQTRSEKARIHFIAIAAEPWHGGEIMYFCSQNFLLNWEQNNSRFPKTFFLMELEYYYLEPL